MENVFAFESWVNGSAQFSAIYSGVEAELFIERHETSGTFANLWVFETREEAEEKMKELYAMNPHILRDFHGISEEDYWNGASPRYYYICPVTGQEVTTWEATY